MPDLSGQVASLIQQLLSLESELTTALMGRPPLLAEPLPSTETLLDLKKVIDRVRPLLWIHLNRSGAKHEPEREGQPAGPSSVSPAAG